MNSRSQAEGDQDGRRQGKGVTPSWRIALLTFGFFLLLHAEVRSDLVLGETDWNSAGLSGWSTSDGWVTLTNPMSGGVNNSGFLQVTLAATDPLEQGLDQWWALVSTPATNLFAGTWDASMYITFDLYAADILPEYVQVQWGTNNSSRVWRNTVYDINEGGLTVGAWTGAKAMLDDYTSWDYGGGDQTQFLDDLAHIDWIGVYIWRGSADAQTYGIDNFRLSVPEPGQVAALAMALLTCAWFFRKRVVFHPPC